MQILLQLLKLSINGAAIFAKYLAQRKISYLSTSAKNDFTGS